MLFWAACEAENSTASAGRRPVPPAGPSRARRSGRGGPGRGHFSLGPAISRNARFTAYSRNNVTVTTHLATIPQTDGVMPM